jgi:hypothetical protein
MDYGSNVLAKNHQRRMIASRNQKCNPPLCRISGMNQAAQFGLQGRPEIRRSIGRRGCRHRRELCGIERVVVVMRLRPRGKLKPHTRHEIFQPGGRRPISGTRPLHPLPSLFSTDHCGNGDFHVVEFVASVVWIAENDDDVEGHADGLRVRTRRPFFLGVRGGMNSHGERQNQKHGMGFAWLHRRFDVAQSNWRRKASGLPAENRWEDLRGVPLGPPQD